MLMDRMQLVYPDDAPLHGQNMDSDASSSFLIRLTGSQQRYKKMIWSHFILGGFNYI